MLAFIRMATIDPCGVYCEHIGKKKWSGSGRGGEWEWEWEWERIDDVELRVNFVRLIANKMEIYKISLHHSFRTSRQRHW